MKLNVLKLLGLIAVLPALAGCYNTLDGRVKAGVPFRKDTIEGRYERPVEQVFNAAKEVVAFNGALQGENTISKTVWGKVDTRTVYVKVDEIDPKLTRVTVQARTKGGGSDIDLASEIDKQIALRLARP